MLQMRHASYKKNDFKFEVMLYDGEIIVRHIGHEKFFFLFSQF